MANINKNANGKKKGLQLVGKLMLVVAIPLVLIVFLGCIIGVSEINNVGEALIKDELQTASYAFRTQMNILSTEDFVYEDGVLYKGDVNITENEKFLEKTRKAAILSNKSDADYAVCPMPSDIRFE